MLPSYSWSCQFFAPSMRTWAYAVIVHGTCCIAGAVPLGSLLFFVNRWAPSSSSGLLHKIVGITIGIAAALIVPVTQSYIESHAPNDNARWVGPFLASTFGFSTFFKAINAGFRQFPQGADTDLSTWLMWFVNLPEPEFTKGKMRHANQSYLWELVRYFVYKILALSILLSVLQIIHETVGYTEQPKHNQSFLAMHILGFLHIWLIYLFASFCLDFSSLSNITTTGGMRMEPGFRNPLLRSRSFTEAWGTRWNMPVQLLLKRTIYVPARKQGLSQGASAILTFFASGLLHEYNFYVHNRIAYEPMKATVFFMLMGFVMLGETWAWENLVPPRIQQSAEGLIPSIVVSIMLTLLVSGIFEQFFIKSWLKSGFLDAAGEMIPYLSCTRH